MNPRKQIWLISPGKLKSIHRELNIMLCGKGSNKKKEVNRTHIMFSLRAFLNLYYKKFGTRFIGLKVIQKFTELRNGTYESTKIQLNYIINLE